MLARGPGDGTRLRGGTIRLRGEETGGALGAYETTLAPGTLIPPHAHDNDVWVYVVGGTTSVLVGDEIAHGGPGTFLLKPRGVVHAMWNEQPEPARIIELLTPGGAERFFEAVHDLADDDDFDAVAGRHGVRFIDDHPRIAELQARVAQAATPAGRALRVVPATPDDHEILARLLELYLYDLAPYAHEGHRDVGPDGRYGYGWLDRYWVDPDRHAFLFEVGGRLAGFALVNRHTVTGPDAWSIAEFFVLRKYRWGGVGRRAAHDVFDRFPGRWEVAQDAPNAPAQAFWRATVRAYTGGAFEVVDLDDDRWRGPVLRFVAPGKPGDTAGARG